MKGKIIIAIISGLFIIAAAVISSPHWFKYFFPEQYLEQEKIVPEKIIEKSKNGKTEKEEKYTGTENIVISKIDLSSRQFNIPSYFYFEIANKGTRTIKQLEIIIDLGKSVYEEFDYSKQLNPLIQSDSLDKTYIKINLPLIKENETFEFYALTSLPTFKSILISGENMTFDKRYTYNEYLESEKDDYSNSSGFQTFLTIMFSITIIVFSIYFIVVIITYLNKLFKL